MFWKRRRPEVPIELRTIEWLPPWHATDDNFAGELKREASPGHVLHGRPAITIARRYDQDDFLFWLPEGPALLAAVHLTYAGRERLPWPLTDLYQSVDEWIEARMRADHSELLKRASSVSEQE